MTPRNLRDCLTKIGWSERHLARVLSLKSSTTVRQWLDGRTRIPSDVSYWLGTLAARHDAASRLVLRRASDGSWSLHEPGSSSEDISSGAAPALISGRADKVRRRWNRPNASDYAIAEDVRSQLNFYRNRDAARAPAKKEKRR